jgi:alpha-beta hydrolase superfamily lysophospholipase
MLACDFVEYILLVIEKLYFGLENIQPIFIVGHGLGALIAIRFLLLNTL